MNLLVHYLFTTKYGTHLFDIWSLVVWSNRVADLGGERTKIFSSRQPQVDKDITDADENVISLSRHINTVSDIRNVSNFINNRPGNIFFKRMRTMCYTSVIKRFLFTELKYIKWGKIRDDVKSCGIFSRTRKYLLLVDRFGFDQDPDGSKERLILSCTYFTGLSRPWNLLQESSPHIGYNSSLSGGNGVIVPKNNSKSLSNVLILVLLKNFWQLVFRILSHKIVVVYTFHIYVNYFTYVHLKSKHVKLWNTFELDNFGNVFFFLWHLTPTSIINLRI